MVAVRCHYPVLCVHACLLNGRVQHALLRRLLVRDAWLAWRASPELSFPTFLQRALLGYVLAPAPQLLVLLVPLLMGCMVQLLFVVTGALTACMNVRARCVCRQL